MGTEVRKRDVATWPKAVRQVIDAVAVAFMHAYMLARGRAAGSPSPTVRALAQRDEEAWRDALREREMGVLRRRLETIPPRKRPLVSPEDRFEILRLMRLHGWSLEHTADRFVLHSNTIRGWIGRFERQGDVGGFFGKPPFNKMGDGVRWLVHEIRRLCPEPEFGTRTIAMMLVRSGIALSRSTVQRILREKPKPPPAPAKKGTAEDVPSIKPHHILRPEKINRTWHLDLTTIEFFWIRFYVAALVDGFSRRLLRLRVFRDAPTSDQMLRLVRGAAEAFGGPTFLVTDHGCQFRRWFRRAVERLSVTLVKGRVRSCQFNGKVERFFKTWRIWQRLTLFAWSLESIQRRLDCFKDWYNAERPMWILDGRTPVEVWRGEASPEAVPIRANDPDPPILQVARRHRWSDHHLPVIEIQVMPRLKCSA